MSVNEILLEKQSGHPNFNICDVRRIPPLVIVISLILVQYFW